MEEHVDVQCSVVYFCAGGRDDIYELYHKQNLPQTTTKSGGTQHALDHVYQNVHTLLDEDQGGFSEVFLCSHPKKCLERLEQYANSGPTVALVELRNQASELKAKNGSYTFLRALCGDIESAHFQKHVMPFALVILEESENNDATPDANLTTGCIHAGAIEVLHSPLHHEDLDRLVGHVRELTRPPAPLIGAQMTQNLVNSIHNTRKRPRLSSHRPDETISTERKKAVETALRHWHFPAQDFNMDELAYAALYMLEHILTVPELAEYTIPRHELMTFILATRRQYKHECEVQYHNWRHAVDVTQSIYCFLLGIRLVPPVEADERKHNELNAMERVLKPLDGLILLVSAIGHDVGHPGVNNAFLVACNHPLAQTYNDKSVLENYHCAAYSQLVRRHWPALNNIAGFRASMISTILATDMQRHFEYMHNLGDLKAKVESSEASVDEWGDKDRNHARELTMALLIKAADISNVARPFDISAKWAKILMTEFARQGELEKELSIPTCLFGGPPDTEDILAAANSQKGFMNLFGFPLFQGIGEIMPTVSCSVKEMENNREIWDKKIEEEKARRGPGNDDAPMTLRSISKDEVEDEQQRGHRKSEPGAVPVQEAQTPSTPTKRSAAATGIETSPSKHAAHGLRQQMAQGIALDKDRRSTAPFLESPSSPLSTPGLGSRRSSKDMALDQLQALTAISNQSSGPGSRRSSADAGVQIHQSYPGSRRGSKDETLTTILVTTGNSPNRRATPPSPGKKTSPNKSGAKRQSVPSHQKSASISNPSSRSQTTSTVTATTTDDTHSTQPSSPGDESTPLADMRAASIPSTEDPFMHPDRWPDEPDHKHRASVQGGLPDAIPSSPPPLGPSTSGSSQADDGRPTPRKSESGLRESRSRSRLRGLKFWRKKSRDVTGADVSAESPGGSP